MSRKPLLTPAPVIAQLVLPHAVRYKLRVFVQNGYLVTRRRRGIGLPLPVEEPRRGIGPPPPAEPQPPRVKYAAYQDYWHPVLNELALQRWGIARREIEAWLAGADHDALTHPVYAPLCLRWGANAEGMYAQQYTTPAGEANRQVMFEPVSDEQSGVTHYELLDPYDQHSWLTEALQAQGLLHKYLVPDNAVGDWRTLYSTDWSALQQALGAHRLVPVLEQHVTQYWVGLRKDANVIAWGEHFYLKSEAEARYAQFPANPAYDARLTEEYPRLEMGAVVLVRGEGVDGWTSAEKVVFKSVSRKNSQPRLG